jgi:hypothetical protein
VKWLIPALVPIAVLCLGTAPRAQNTQAQSGTGRVKVEVTGESGPIENADVRAGAQHVVTSAAGEATLTLPAGQVELAVEHAGFLPQPPAPPLSPIRRQSSPFVSRRSPPSMKT